MGGSGHNNDGIKESSTLTLPEKMDKDYAEKLKNIDKSISKKIEDEAKAKGYEIVLSKGIVLFGGKDITNEIIKAVK